MCKLAISFIVLVNHLTAGENAKEGMTWAHWRRHASAEIGHFHANQTFL